MGERMKAAIHRWQERRRQRRIELLERRNTASTTLRITSKLLATKAARQAARSTPPGQPAGQIPAHPSRLQRLGQR